VRAILFAAAVTVCLCAAEAFGQAAENTLTDAERRDGWVLLFDGKTYAGWMNSDGTKPRKPVEDGALNPHGAGHYMLVYEKQWENFVLSLDFKIAPRCNSGVFVRTGSLTPRPGKDIGFNGLEIAIDDTAMAGFVDTGAIYDLSKPARNVMRPAGEWNHLEITCNGPLIEVVLNAEKVNSINLDQFIEPNKRPDGAAHKFDIAYRDHPRKGYIGLQDHGSPCWFKNVKLRPSP
jgi:alpha-3'-ketoglucosidase